MAIDPINWRREMKKFIGAELSSLQDEIANLCADLKTSTPSDKTSTTDKEISALKNEISQLRTDLNSLTELVKIIAANQLLNNVEREINPSQITPTALAEIPPVESTAPVENSLNDESYNARTQTMIQNRTLIYEAILDFVICASKFKSKVKIKAKGKTVDAKSIPLIMSMGLTKGTEITITADGPDAFDAVCTLKKLVDDKFGED